MYPCGFWVSFPTKKCPASAFLFLTYRKNMQCKVCSNKYKAFSINLHGPSITLSNQKKQSLTSYEFFFLVSFKICRFILTVLLLSETFACHFQSSPVAKIAYRIIFYINTTT